MNKESVRKQVQLVNVDGSVKMPDGTFTSAEFAIVKFISEMETMQETIESQNKQVSYWMGQGQKAEKEAEALQQENERLAMELSVAKSQLEEVKGKLVMLGEAIVKAQEIFAPKTKVDGEMVPLFWNHDHAKHILDVYCLLGRANNALSPDIQHYREEIEREAFVLGIREIIENVPHFDPDECSDWDLGFNAGRSASMAILQSLLPKLKEVSD